MHDLANELGWRPVITSTIRTYQQQAELYRKYKAGLSRFPAARPGTSIHETGFAFDMDLLKDESLLKYLGEVWEDFGPGFRWGGRFKDAVHFEYRRPK